MGIPAAAGVLADRGVRIVVGTAVDMSGVTEPRRFPWLAWRR